jgi:hypothetical protein
VIRMSFRGISGVLAILGLRRNGERSCEFGDGTSSSMKTLRSRGNRDGPNKIIYIDQLCDLLPKEEHKTVRGYTEICCRYRRKFHPTLMKILLAD